MRSFGLIGKDISYSFSKKFFTQKFSEEGIHATYENCHIETIEDFRSLLKEKKWNGFNVTIPYKEEIIPYLDELSEEAAKIGAVNTIVWKDSKLIGYNTDYFGFLKTIFGSLEKQHSKALILGTGGASKAVKYALESLSIQTKYVSRTKNETNLSYKEIDKTIMDEYKVIINCSPLGTFPKVSECPGIPYQYVTSEHLMYDLVYNPPLTKFLAQGKHQGASVINGYQMLIEQALKAWEIWNKQ